MHVYFFILEKHGVSVYISLFGTPQMPANYPEGLYVQFNFFYFVLKQHTALLHGLPPIVCEVG